MTRDEAIKLGWHTARTPKAIAEALLKADQDAFGRGYNAGRRDSAAAIRATITEEIPDAQ